MKSIEINGEKYVPASECENLKSAKKMRTRLTKRTKITKRITYTAWVNDFPEREFSTLEQAEKYIKYLKTLKENGVERSASVSSERDTEPSRNVRKNESN